MSLQMNDGLTDFVQGSLINTGVDGGQDVHEIHSHMTHHKFSRD
jgi:hypothetical protein